MGIKGSASKNTSRDQKCSNVRIPGNFFASDLALWLLKNERKYIVNVARGYQTWYIGMLDTIQLILLSVIAQRICIIYIIH